MKLNASPLEVIIFIIFVLYLVFQIKTPFLAGFIDSPVGMIVVFGLTIFMFLYSHPILGILSIFVAYELLSRSSIKIPNVIPQQQVLTQPKIDAEIKAMNPPKEITLEEDIVKQMAPVAKSEPSGYVVTSFKPVAENVHGASAM
jgi:hypothetical protein